MCAIYPSQESVSEILDDSAPKWDAHGPGLRLINPIYVKLAAGRPAQGGTNSSAQIPAYVARSWSWSI